MPPSTFASFYIKIFASVNKKASASGRQTALSPKYTTALCLTNIVKAAKDKQTTFHFAQSPSDKMITWCLY